jgi:hypothetical protein
MKKVEQKKCWCKIPISEREVFIKTFEFNKFDCNTRESKRIKKYLKILYCPRCGKKL